MKKGQIVKYIGKGFLGFDLNDIEMIFLEKDGNFDSYVEYKGKRMLVRNNEIKSV